MGHSQLPAVLLRVLLCVCVKALGKIAEHHDRPTILPVWLAALPLMEDHFEGEVVYTQLCTYVEKNNPVILGKNYCNMPKLVSIFARTFCGTTATPQLL